MLTNEQFDISLATVRDILHVYKSFHSEFLKMHRVAPTIFRIEN